MIHIIFTLSSDVPVTPLEASVYTQLFEFRSHIYYLFINHVYCKYVL